MEALADVVRRVVLAASLAEDPHRTEVKKGGLSETGKVADITVQSLGRMVERVMAQATPFYAAVSDLRAALARLADEKNEGRAVTALLGALRALPGEALSKGPDDVNLIQGDLVANGFFLVHLAQALNLAHSEHSSDAD